MSHKSKAAQEATSGESVQTKIAEVQEQSTTAQDGTTAGAVPAVAGAEGTINQSQTIAVTSTQSEDSPHAHTGVQAEDFLTFDPNRKHLVRVVGINGEYVTVRRFDKKSGKWLTKPESRDRNSGVSLSADEAENSFPGCVAAWEKAAPELANLGSPVPNKNQALITAIKKIENIEYHAPDFKDAKELRTAFDEAHNEVKTKGISAIDSRAEVILALAKMQAILSQRGKEKMRRDAGINQTWIDYYKWFQKEFNFDLTLRAVQYKVRELAGEKRERKCSECHKPDGHAKSCSKYKQPTPPHLTQLEVKLLDAASRAHGVVKAVKQGGNVDEAITDFEKNAPTPEKLVEYAERPVKPSLADASTKPSKQPSNGVDYRKMLVDLLDQIEKLGSRIPVELHTKCKEYRSTIGRPPNVRSKSKGKVTQNTDPITDGAAMAAQIDASINAVAEVPLA